MKTIGATLFATLFIMFAVSMPVAKSDEHWDAKEIIKNKWETSTHTNETTNQVEKRLVYWYPENPRHLSMNMSMISTMTTRIPFLFIVPCDNTKLVKIKTTGVIQTSYHYRPVWYQPRGKINVRLDKKEWSEWEAIAPEDTSNWLHITAPSTSQVIQQLKDHDSLRLHIKQYPTDKEHRAPILKMDIESTEFASLYDSHCD